MAKTHRCPATSKRFWFVAHTAASAGLPLSAPTEAAPAWPLQA